jgi:hypothetical protein
MKKALLLGIPSSITSSTNRETLCRCNSDKVTALMSQMQEKIRNRLMNLGMKTKNKKKMMKMMNSKKRLAKKKGQR